MNERYVSVELDTRIYTKLPLRISRACAATGFRLRRTEYTVGQVVYRPRSCYSFNNYMEVPEEWNNTKDRIFNMTSMWQWNQHEVMLGPCSLRSMQRAYVFVTI